MSTPIYHIACYKEAKGRDAQPKPARWKGYCTHCGKRIWTGDPITWSRRTATADGAPEGQDGGQLNADAEKGPGDESGLPDMSEPEAPEATEPADQDSADSISSVLNVKALARALLPELEGKLGARKGNGGIVANVITVTVAHADGTPPKDMGLQHKQFPTLLAACAARLNGNRMNVWLAGPSGSGKTHASEKVAEALGLPFYYTGVVGDQYGLSGYKDATGTYVRTLFREAYENGGVFLLDEVDGSDPSATLWLNGALANGVASFPDAMVKRHPDCVVIAAANTWGHGATHEYVGRNRLDTAFIKRFVFLQWDYDADLELAAAPNLQWTKRVQAVRARVMSKGIRVMVTPRESFFGAALLAQGLDQETVECMTIRSGMTAEQWDQVR